MTSAQNRNTLWTCDQEEPCPWGIYWVLVSQIKIAVGGAIQVGGQRYITDRLFYHTLYATLDIDLIWLDALAIMLAGGATGLAQWLVLRRRVRHAGWWILASAISWGIVGLVTAGTLPFP